MGVIDSLLQVRVVGQDVLDFLKLRFLSVLIEVTHDVFQLLDVIHFIFG